MKIFICGGGTGGHFFSGVALAEEFLKHYPQYHVEFIGTKNGIEGRVTLDDPRMSITFIRAKGLKGKGLLSKIFGIFYLAIGMFESAGLLLKHKPKIVFGVGGYASAPTLFAALALKWLCGWQIAILEQNSKPGLVNRLFSKLGVRAFAAFEIPGFEMVNLPLRSSALQKISTVRSVAWPPKNLLILGGSQGARGLNARWKEIAASLFAKYPGLKVFHQTGREAEEEFRSFYREQKLNAEAFAFSNDMPRYYEMADLLICRSGAMTIFEVMAFKRPAVFVPFPFATDDHQRTNALAVQTPEWVIDEKNFSLSSIEKIFRSEPKIPARTMRQIRSWDAIFTEMLL
jgi:UDP-N-acetylglucosamine--N-acetylmuramyl-(pentapeptide) pyrophosphoryl-undecaprenol N-acetylglucosamine transferase